MQYEELGGPMRMKKKHELQQEGWSEIAPSASVKESTGGGAIWLTPLLQCHIKLLFIHMDPQPLGTVFSRLTGRLRGRSEEFACVKL